MANIFLEHQKRRADRYPVVMEALGDAIVELERLENVVSPLDCELIEALLCKLRAVVMEGEKDHA